MNRFGRALAATVAALLLLTQAAMASGVGGASWTPDRSTTTARDSRFLIPGDAIIFRTEAVWDRRQSDGLAGYLGGGVRYTHEVNDSSGRLSATGFWATNHPDPAFDRDDDDGDRRWEEAEIIAGREAPEPGRRYTAAVQFSRWHGKRVKRQCVWAWDRRKGNVQVLSQLSRDLLGEWQAERYTLAYDEVAFPRVDRQPALPASTARARCRDADPGTGQEGFVITFARPLGWAEMTGQVSVGSAKWTAFEAIGRSRRDDLVWTCGGPFDRELRMSPCRGLGVDVDGVTAAVGYFDELAIEQLRGSAEVAAVDRLRDSLTGLLYDVGGLGVERPGLTVDDRYWDLFLAE